MLVDPSLAVGERGAPSADAVVVSHAHEDHLVAIDQLPAPVHVHEADVAAVRSFEVLLAGSGLPEEAAREFGRSLASDFHVRSRPDALAVADGHRFELGGRTATVVHLPGHTAEHCSLLVEPDGFFYVADIDLSSLGPFHGDVGSSLADFERSLEGCGAVEARWYGTFHHKGVIDGRGSSVAG
ncbi:MBL fold metallo-hydrolase [Pseudonocardia sp. NPDC049154]|uniref:MBL fold metallo-hydrolase n=1 Tax=Pseudonocardia sp. NPDC049154 TaxID=3155501 RepID=UPI0033DFA3DA